MWSMVEELYGLEMATVSLMLQLGIQLHTGRIRTPAVESSW